MAWGLLEDARETLAVTLLEDAMDIMGLWPTTHGRMLITEVDLIGGDPWKDARDTLAGGPR
jgi:hypothetical protein